MDTFGYAYAMSIITVPLAWDRNQLLFIEAETQYIIIGT